MRINATHCALLGTSSRFYAFLRASMRFGGLTASHNGVAQQHVSAPLDKLRLRPGLRDRSRFAIVQATAGEMIAMSTRTKVTDEQRIAQLQARIEAIKARANKRSRADETKRKILLGALVLERWSRAVNTPVLSDWIALELNGFLTRDSDRAIFGDILGKTS
jgi:hypothetical protein